WPKRVPYKPSKNGLDTDKPALPQVEFHTLYGYTPQLNKPRNAPAIPTKLFTCDAMASLSICCAASVAPIEWPITSILPVQELAKACCNALRTGVSSLPLWSLQAAQLFEPQSGW